MQIEELFSLCNWINLNVDESKIVQKYQNLYQILHANIQPNQTKQPFEIQKDDLILSLKAINLNDLSIGQIELLETVGIKRNVAEHGVALIEDALYKNVIDVASSASVIQKCIQEINAGVTWAKQLKESLGLVINEDSVIEEAGSVIIRVHFQKNANISNLDDLKAWATAWHDIGRGIAIAKGHSPADIKIIGASKGSLILTLVAIYGVVEVLSKTIMEILKVVEKCLDIKKAIVEIKALKLSNQTAVLQLQKDLDELKETGVERIVQDISADLRLNDGTQGDKIKSLEKSVKKLTDFIEKGGEVDFVMPEQHDSTGSDAKSQEKLRKIIDEVRAIENKIKSLEKPKD